MKKITKFLMLLLALTVVFAMTFVASAEDDITVLVDGQGVIFDVPPMITNGRTMVPLRAIFEALGATVEWDGDTSTCTAVKGETTVKLTIGADTMYVNGDGKKLDAPGRIVESRTLVPLRAVSEAFSCSVTWYGPSRTASIVSDPDNYTVMFNESGISLLFRNSMVDAQLAAGWYTEPLVTLYAADGSAKAFPQSKVTEQLAVGWYTNKADTYITLYSADGRTLEVLKAEVETYKNLGWYDEPLVTLYTADGRSQAFPKSKVAAQLSVGWYENWSDVSRYYYSVDGLVYSDLKTAEAEHLNITHGYYPKAYTILNSEYEAYTDYYLKNARLTDGIPVLEGYDKQTGWIYHRDNWEYTYLYLLGYSDISTYDLAAFDEDKMDPPGVLEYASDVVTLYIGYGPKYISSNTFSKFTNLRRAEIAPSVTSIGNEAFGGCEYLERIGIPASVTSIDANAFGNNKNLTIYCEAGSYAERFAEYYGIKYVTATTLYYLDGRSCMVDEREKELFLGNGWYEELMTTVYAPDGRTSVIPASKVEKYISVGWYKNWDEVYTTMYSLDGRTLTALNINVAANQKVGWYLWADYICAMADEDAAWAGYEWALETHIDPVIEYYRRQPNGETNSDYIKIYNKGLEICEKWSREVGAPAVIVDMEVIPAVQSEYIIIDDKYYIPDFVVSTRNISGKEITRITFEYNCYDKNGREVNYSVYYPKTFLFGTQYPGELIVWEEDNLLIQGTKEIRNMRITGIQFSDGTEWTGTIRYDT